MARKKKTDDTAEQETWPKIIQGSHSTRTEYEDGRVEFVTDWEALKRDVKDAILKYESNVPAQSDSLLTDSKSSVKVIKNKPLRIKKPKNEA